MYLTSSWFPTRIPVSLVLLPIFWLVLAISPNLNQWRSLWVLIIVYGFLFSAVNGFSNYFGQEAKSNASKIVLTTSVVLYLASIVLAFLKVGVVFGILIVLYGIVSIPFNFLLTHSRKYTAMGWGLSGMIQGVFTFVLLYLGINQYSIENADQTKIFLPGLLISMVLWAFYPVIHKSPISRQASDYKTVFKISQHRLFLLTLELFTIAIVFTGFYFKNYISWVYFPPLLLFYLAGVLFLYFRFLPREIKYLNFLGWLSIIGLNAFFFYLFIDYTNIFQLLS